MCLLFAGPGWRGRLCPGRRGADTAPRERGHVAAKARVADGRDEVGDGEGQDDCDEHLVCESLLE